MRQEFAFLCVCLVFAASVQARIVKIDIQGTSAPASDGYVTITGRAYGEVDPAHPLNAIIQDIKLAPRNARRMVEYSMDWPALIPGKAYTVLVPKVDADGNETAGIRPTTVQAPIATYTGWNLQREGFAEGELCQNTGSYIPFHATRVEREAARDPRLSLEERYGNHAGYVEAVRKAADRLVTQRLLLRQDAEAIIAGAEKSTVLVRQENQPPQGLKSVEGRTAKCERSRATAGRGSAL